MPCLTSSPSFINLVTWRTALASLRIHCYHTVLSLSSHELGIRGYVSYDTHGQSAEATGKTGEELAKQNMLPVWGQLENSSLLIEIIENKLCLITLRKLWYLFLMSSIEYFDSVFGASVGIPFLEALLSMPSFFHAGIQTTEFYFPEIWTHTVSLMICRGSGTWEFNAMCALIHRSLQVPTTVKEIVGHVYMARK